MTDKKEEILKRIHSGRIMNYEDVFRQNPSIIQSAYEMADEYAKQQAVDFGEWLSNHKLDFQPATEGRWIGLDMKMYTNDDLYTQFLDHQNKQP